MIHDPEQRQARYGTKMWSGLGGLSAPAEGRIVSGPRRSVFEPRLDLSRSLLDFCDLVNPRLTEDQQRTTPRRLPPSCIHLRRVFRPAGKRPEEGKWRYHIPVQVMNKNLSHSLLQRYHGLAYVNRSITIE